MLMQDAEIQLVRPPILVGLATAVQLGDGTMHHRAAACFLIAHVCISASGRVLRDYADQPSFPLSYCLSPATKLSTGFDWHN